MRKRLRLMLLPILALLGLVGIVPMVVGSRKEERARLSKPSNFSKVSLISVSTIDGLPADGEFRIHFALRGPPSFFLGV